MENKAGLGVRKGAWTKEEDLLLKDFIEEHGEGKWHLVPIRAGLNRCRKSCRLRWLNYLRPNIKRGYFTKDEVDLILRLHKLLGNSVPNTARINLEKGTSLNFYVQKRWSLIAGRLPGRTANDVKNLWNSHIHKKVSCPTSETSKKTTITESNIIRPKPHRFLRSHEPQTNNQPNLQNYADKNPNSSSAVTPENGEKNDQPLLQPSGDESKRKTLNEDEFDECFRWWNSLLEGMVTENGSSSEFYDKGALDGGANYDGGVGW